MTPLDTKSLKEALMILRRLRDQLIKQAKHCQDENVRTCINEIAAETNNQIHILRKRYQSPLEEKTNHDQQS